MEAVRHRGQSRLSKPIDAAQVKRQRSYMPRQLRIEYPGAIYHVMNRGDRSEPIFGDDADRKRFLETLDEVCSKTDWQVHAYCLMANHFHLVVETPNPNLVAGMKWFLGTYTGRFNRRHQLFGHLFSGRYKSLIIDERGGGYLKTACDYVHLNPVRAGLVASEAPLSAYEWSSYPLYLRPTRRPDWLRVDRLLGEHGIQKGSAKGRIHFQERMEARRKEGEAVSEWAAFRRGWHLGAEDFAQRLSERLGRRGHQHELARERKETDEQLAERMVGEWLASTGWGEAELKMRPKGDKQKAALARLLRRHTPMSRQWIAKRLHIGSVAYVTKLTARKKQSVVY